LIDEKMVKENAACFAALVVFFLGLFLGTCLGYLLRQLVMEGG
jgi:hypothetical protein